MYICVHNIYCADNFKMQLHATINMIVDTYIRVYILS